MYVTPLNTVDIADEYSPAMMLAHRSNLCAINKLLASIIRLAELQGMPGESRKYKGPQCRHRDHVVIAPRPSSKSSHSKPWARSELVGAFVKDMFICQRQATVKALWKLIEKKGVALVCGPSCSGKSTLGWLMIKYAQKVMGKKAAYISGWDHRKSTKENLFDACKHLPGLADAPETFDVLGCGVFFVLDDAQITYSVDDLWNTHLKSCGKTQALTKFLILARYGSNSKRKDEYATTPPIPIDPDQQVFLRVPSIPGYPSVSLCFDLVELTDTVRQHELESNLPYHLSDATIVHLLTISHGHAGLVKSILEFLYQEFDAEWRNTEVTQRSFTAEISPETFRRYTSDTPALLKGVRSRILGRSLMKPSNYAYRLIPGIRDLLRRILLQGPVLYDPDDREHRVVYISGICQGQVERVRHHSESPYENFSIVSSDDDDSCFRNGDTVEEVHILLVFPTMIHAL
jgi:hypothetical protein